MKEILKKFLSVLEKILRIILIILASLTVIVAIIILVWMIGFSDSPKEWLELRIGNIVEYQLDKDDGITNEEMIEAAKIAFKRSLAAKGVCENKMIEDAFRHFSWNMEGTLVLGEEKMKIIADNHEFALMIKDDMLDCYYTHYHKYREMGKWPFNAYCLAIEDAKKYVSPCRRIFVLSLDEDVENQRKHYDRYTVMDFWNNLKGREFSHYFESEDYMPAFSDARAMDEIIETYKEVDDMNYTVITNYIINETIY